MQNVNCLLDNFKRTLLVENFNYTGSLAKIFNVGN